MTGPKKENLENLDSAIDHIKGRLDKFKRVRDIIEFLSEGDADVTLFAPPDARDVTVLVEERGEPSNYMEELLRLQDGSNSIEYEPGGNIYRLKVKFYMDR